MKSMQFETKDKDGNKIVCDVIATYHDDNTNKDYIVYTDKTIDENNNLRTYYSLYRNVNDGIELIEIISNEDRKVGLQLIKEIVSDLKDN